MKLSPKFILYFTCLPYLGREKRAAFKLAIKTKIVTNDVEFMKVFYRFVDIEKIPKKLHRREDISVYNFLKYDNKKTKLPRKGALAKYEKEVVLPYLHSHPRFVKQLFKDGVYYLMGG